MFSFFRKKSPFTVVVKEFDHSRFAAGMEVTTDKHDYRKDVTALQQTFQSKRSLLKEPSNPSGTLVATSLPDEQGHFSYFVGDLVDSSEQEEELLVKELPVGAYAQINVDFKDPSGLTLAVAKAKNYFFNKWLPDSGYEVLPGIESYELYDRRSRIKLASMLLIFPLRKKLFIALGGHVHESYPHAPSPPAAFATAIHKSAGIFYIRHPVAQPAGWLSLSGAIKLCLHRRQALFSLRPVRL